MPPTDAAAFAFHSTSLSSKDRYFSRPLGSDLPIYSLSELSDRRWEFAARSKLSQLLNLPADWDSYGAAPVDRTAATTAFQVLAAVMTPDVPNPWIVPTPGGKLQIEWHCKGVDIEIEVRSPTSLHLFFNDLQTGEEWEIPVSVDLEPVADVIARLANR